MESACLSFVCSDGTVYGIENALRSDLELPERKNIQDDIYVLDIPSECWGWLIPYDVRNTEALQ